MVPGNKAGTGRVSRCAMRRPDRGRAAACQPPM